MGSPSRLWQRRSPPDHVYTTIDATSLTGLAKASFGELCAQKGVSEAKACQLMAALELGRRMVSLQPESLPMITSPANLLMGEMALMDQEHLRVILLNTKNQGAPRNAA